MDNQLKSRMRFIVSAFSLALITVTACDTGPVEPVGRRQIRLVTGGGGGGGTAASASIVGTWQRTLVFFDDFGFMHSSETTWDFSTGGTAERSVVTTNITLGASDTVFTDARWRLEGTNLIIDFTAPSSGTITLEARVQGTSLFLAGQEYLRIS
jgi:hypothetical protein